MALHGVYSVINIIMVNHCYPTNLFFLSKGDPDVRALPRALQHGHGRRPGRLLPGRRVSRPRPGRGVGQPGPAGKDQGQDYLVWNLDFQIRIRTDPQ